MRALIFIRGETAPTKPQYVYQLNLMTVTSQCTDITRKARPFRALLIDLDGVLRLWPSSHAILEQTHGLPVGALNHTAFEPILLDEVVTGKISDETWREKIAERLTLAHPDANVSDAVATWSAGVGELNQLVFDLVKRLPADISVILVTNVTSRLNRDLEALGLANFFYSTVNASEIGFAKPSPEIFVAALKAANVAASEALFVDESTGNVAVAAQLGMRAFHFTSVEGLSAFFSETGVSERLSEHD